MRKSIFFVLLALVSSGCQRILFFRAQPSSAAVGPVEVTLNWRLSAGEGWLSADQKVPLLEPEVKVNTQGSRTVEVCKTTTFTLEPHYGGERKVTVNVAKPCDAPVPCLNQVLTFTGTCVSGSQGPVYTAQTVAANGAPGNLKDLFTNADFPIHVLHSGADIAMSAGGGPLDALPNVPAAGEYQIFVPGQVGVNLCQEASNPVGGGQVDAPPVQLTVVPTCPKS